MHAKKKKEEGKMLVNFFKKYMGMAPDQKVSLQNLEAFIERDLSGDRLNEEFADDKILKILHIRALDRIACNIEDFKDRMLMK